MTTDPVGLFQAPQSFPNGSRCTRMIMFKFRMKDSSNYIVLPDRGWLFSQSITALRIRFVGKLSCRPEGKKKLSSLSSLYGKTGPVNLGRNAQQPQNL